jgi:acyl carrier protein
MNTIASDPKAIQDNVVRLIASVTNITPDQLIEVRDLTRLGLDIIDVVDIILKVEETYHITIPDEVPVYTVDDFINFIYVQSLKQAS